ncbi:rifampicin phosphotransferase-like [Oscarella lobularis]|uniref:rifampicin phosphotransferase-like n=1 Tax=Oscarella lobularis TaxID=121494 RepID=UPI0033135D2F
MALIVDSSSNGANLSAIAGGKATNMSRLSQFAFCNVPPWFCVTTHAFDAFVEKSDLQSLLRVDDDLERAATAVEAAFESSPLPDALESEIASRLDRSPFVDHFVAVRSSGTDEDSAAHSFAGQFETYLFQRGAEQVRGAVRRCWASCFSARVMQHRRDCGLPLAGVKMAVVIQVMVNSEYSGVAFSRHPLKPMSSNSSYVEAVYGLGEGLVGGKLSSDSYEVNRDTLKVTKTLIEKDYQFLQAQGGGVEKAPVAADKKEKSVLTDEQAVEICQLITALERELGRPQDFEYGFEKGVLYCLQTRPILTLPPSCFFNLSAVGSLPTLWDNSNTVESYSGVTTPLTFSFASYVYGRVYTSSLLVAGVPETVVKRHEPFLRNMLGYVRGNIYYNLVNWYRCLACIPIGNTGKFMDTMMGVKQSLEGDLEQELGRIRDTAPKYGIWAKMKVWAGVAHNIYRIDALVEGFFENFNQHYTAALATDFEKLSLTEQIEYFKKLLTNVVDRWEVPVINDSYVILFFGILKKLVSSLLCKGDGDKAQSLQNDLLCGQGDVESTKPTKMLMSIAEYIDTSGSSLREWFLTEREELTYLVNHQLGIETVGEPSGGDSDVSQGKVRARRSSVASSNRRTNSENGVDIEGQKVEVAHRIKTFLTLYGFRCVDELKLESSTLLDDPSFILDTLRGYVRSGSYSVDAMEKREHEIKTNAEEVVSKSLPFYYRIFFNWILSHTRRAVKHRENMRFARAKLWGIIRSLFRAVGLNLKKLGLTDDKEDVFYLTLDELYAFNEGRSVTNNLRRLVAIRREEIDEYRKSLPPPERFLTRGAAGCYMGFPAILDLLKEHEAQASSDPNDLMGTACCPGVIQGKVRVVKSIDEARGMNGEILVTARTDPGRVPFYPICSGSGLLIERGSLLSHSAVVARELGLPTVVGVSGGLMKRLKTGMTVHVDARKGKITILEKEKKNGDDNNEEK